MQTEITSEYLAAQGLSRSITSRFWNKVHKTPNCWLWEGAANPKYGVIAKGPKPTGMIFAHRLSWLLANGSIPEGLMVLHACDNPLCVNPSHLKLGTHADNMIDRDKKLRQARCEKQGMAKLTYRIAEQIRAEYLTVRSYRRLAKKYEVCHRTIRDIVKNVKYVVPC